MSQDIVRYEVSDWIAEITLNRAPVNALSLQLIDALLDALKKAKSDPAVRAVIIASAHKVFCAGLDIDIVRGKSGLEAKGFLERLYFELNDVQYRLGKPSIAAIDGAARAGGVTIAVSCDMIIAGEKASFGYPEIDVGLIPALHFVQLPRLVGKHQAFARSEADRERERQIKAWDEFEKKVDAGESSLIQEDEDGQAIWDAGDDAHEKMHEIEMVLGLGWGHTSAAQFQRMACAW
jgi:enoyl-CoA hydratase/carnithine racemase